MIRNLETSEDAALPADSIIVERDDGLFQTGLCDAADGQFPDRRSGCSPEGGSPSALVGAAMSDAVIIAQLIGDDTAKAGDIVVRSRSPPVFALCRALLAAGAKQQARMFPPATGANLRRSDDLSSRSSSRKAPRQPGSDLPQPISISKHQ
jgi:hypothetical protein